MRGRVAKTAVAVVVTGLLRAPAVAQSPPALSRVRPIDPRARELLLDAWRSSQTVRTLIETLKASDLIVQVESQKVLAMLRARLRFISAVEGCRYLRVSVEVPGRRADLLPALAHELQHAVEIAQTPEVRDEQGLQNLFRRTGWQWKPTVFETGAALTIEERVRLEVRLAAKRRP